MGAAKGLVDDAVDDPKRLKVGRGDLHRFGCFGALSAVRHRIEAQPSGEMTE